MCDWVSKMNVVLPSLMVAGVLFALYCIKNIYVTGAYWLQRQFCPHRGGGNYPPVAKALSHRSLREADWHQSRRAGEKCPSLRAAGLFSNRPRER